MFRIPYLVYFFVAFAACQPKEINVILLEQIERDPAQWPAIIDWAQRRIASDNLLPAGYKLK